MAIFLFFAMIKFSKLIFLRVFLWNQNFERNSKITISFPFFSLGAVSIQAIGHLPSSWEVQGTNYAQIIDSDVTEIDDGLIRIQNQNALVFTFTKKGGWFSEWTIR